MGQEMYWCSTSSFWQELLLQSPCTRRRQTQDASKLARGALQLSSKKFFTGHVCACGMEMLRYGKRKQH